MKLTTKIDNGEGATNTNKLIAESLGDHLLKKYAQACLETTRLFGQ